MEAGVLSPQRVVSAGPRLFDSVHAHEKILLADMTVGVTPRASHFFLAVFKASSHDGTAKGATCAAVWKMFVSAASPMVSFVAGVGWLSACTGSNC